MTAPSLTYLNRRLLRPNHRLLGFTLAASPTPWPVPYTSPLHMEFVQQRRKVTHFAFCWWGFVRSCAYEPATLTCLCLDFQSCVEANSNRSTCSLSVTSRVFASPDYGIREMESYARITLYSPQLTHLWLLWSPPCPVGPHGYSPLKLHVCPLHNAS